MGKGLCRAVREEKGAALVIAMLVMVVCALLGAASILVSTTDIQISSNDRVYKEALMAADAGVQWLRTQNLQNMTGFSTSDLNSLNAQIASSSPNVRFQIPLQQCADGNWRPVCPAGVDPSPAGGGAQVFRVRSRGFDRNQRGQVLLEAEIRSVPPAGEVDQGGSPTTY